MKRDDCAVAGTPPDATYTLSIHDALPIYTPDAVNDSDTVAEDSSANTIHVRANDTDADNLTAPFNAGLTVIDKTNGSDDRDSTALNSRHLTYTQAADC